MSIEPSFPPELESEGAPDLLEAASCGLEQVDRLPRPEDERSEAPSPELRLPDEDERN